jgi:hypothetical protein
MQTNLTIGDPKNPSAPLATIILQRQPFPWKVFYSDDPQTGNPCVRLGFPVSALSHSLQRVELRSPRPLQTPCPIILKNQQ